MFWNCFARNIFCVWLSADHLQPDQCRRFSQGLHASSQASHLNLDAAADMPCWQPYVEDVCNSPSVTDWFCSINTDHQSSTACSSPTGCMAWSGLPPAPDCAMPDCYLAEQIKSTSPQLPHLAYAAAKQGMTVHHYQSMLPSLPSSHYIRSFAWVDCSRCDMYFARSCIFWHIPVM